MMRKLMIIVVSALAFASANPPSTAPAQTPMADGELTKIDKAQSKITLRHGPIKSLDMASMTMVFRVQDPKMLETVKLGDKVKFEAGRMNGQITITRIERAK